MDKIELRSEKVSNIIGLVPPIILKRGTVIISIVVIILIGTAYFIPYIESINTDIKVFSNPASFQYISQCNGTIYLDDDVVRLNKAFKNSYLGYILSEDNKKIDMMVEHEGRLILNCSEGMKINKGDVIFASIPDSIFSVYGIADLSYDYVNKIHIGQQILGMFDNNGMSKGIISKIYPLPINEDRKFRIEVEFPSSAFAYNNKDCFFTPGIKGCAEIIISRKSLLYKIVKY